MADIGGEKTGQGPDGYATEHSPVAREIMRLMVSPIVENPRIDLYNAARELEILEILEIAVKQASGHSDLFALHEDEFEAVIRKFRPYLGRCMIERQMDAFNLPPFKLSIRPITSAFGHTPQSIFEYVAVLV